MMTQACSSDLCPTPLPFSTLPRHTTKSDKATIQNDILDKKYIKAQKLAIMQESQVNGYHLDTNSTYHKYRNKRYYNVIKANMIASLNVKKKSMSLILRYAYNSRLLKFISSTDTKKTKNKNYINFEILLCQ